MGTFLIVHFGVKSLTFIFLIPPPYSDLRLSRTRLLELFTDSSCNPEMMKNATDLYFSLLQGRNIDMHYC